MTMGEALNELAQLRSLLQQLGYSVAELTDGFSVTFHSDEPSFTVRYRKEIEAVCISAQAWVPSETLPISPREDILLCRSIAVNSVNCRISRGAFLASIWDEDVAFLRIFSVERFDLPCGTLMLALWDCRKTVAQYMNRLCRMIKEERFALCDDLPELPDPPPLGEHMSAVFRELSLMCDRNGYRCQVVVENGKGGICFGEEIDGREYVCLILCDDENASLDYIIGAAFGAGDMKEECAAAANLFNSHLLYGFFVVEENGNLYYRRSLPLYGIEADAEMLDDFFKQSMLCVMNHIEYFEEIASGKTDWTFFIDG